MYINKCTNSSKCNLPLFDENVSNLCSAKLKSTLVDNSDEKVLMMSSEIKIHYIACI